ncbi:hypothetical protein [Actinoplanes utahensis]|uniref:Major facilitator superfamily (MFS) profile domain-containing protein n=1 Tax=Actinoplanes utahensis TaxID=1869 RepID=A0A0A6UPU9_ACTUT|nr:hypothetical protein MB27_06820 [Actinoplanes utahensis]GIF30662.1 hypothetical protein Aut01nite_36480 [Actinoplanes utahensis]
MIIARLVPRSAAGWTIAVFGAMAALVGVVGPVSPAVVQAGVAPAGFLGVAAWEAAGAVATAIGLIVDRRSQG